MKKLLLQAGHKNRTSGATGAPGEKDWNVWCTNSVKEHLKDKIDVTIIDADNWGDEVQQDYDLFLSVHYDADIYNDSGGFTGYPEPSTDYATEASVELSRKIGSYFFGETGIAWKKARSVVKNIRYYYMWKYISASTPCVIIECGVGWRKPEDYTVLRKPSTPQILANAILSALGEEENDMQTDCIEEFDVEEDIPGEIEEKFNPNLKEHEWYDKNETWQWLANFADDQYKKCIELGQDVIKLNERISELNSEINNLKLENDELDDALGECRTRVLALEKERGQLAAELVEKEKTITTLTQENNRLKKENIKLADSLLECQNKQNLCDYSWFKRFKSIFVCPKGGE